MAERGDKVGSLAPHYYLKQDSTLDICHPAVTSAPMVVEALQPVYLDSGFAAGWNEDCRCEDRQKVAGVFGTFGVSKLA